jgi:hypothetical protein
MDVLGVEQKSWLTSDLSPLSLSHTRLGQALFYVLGDSH